MGGVYSNQSGRYEIYVRPFPPTTTGSGGKQVSSSGGIEARWRGNEIFYISPDNMLMAVPVKTGPVFEMTGAPHPLFRTRPVGVERYDVTADGQRFLVAVPADESWGGPATVVLNWPEELNAAGAPRDRDAPLNGVVRRYGCESPKHGSAEQTAFASGRRARMLREVPSSAFRPAA